MPRGAGTRPQSAPNRRVSTRARIDVLIADAAFNSAVDEASLLRRSRMPLGIVVQPLVQHVDRLKNLDGAACVAATERPGNIFRRLFDALRTNEIVEGQAVTHTSWKGMLQRLRSHCGNVRHRTTPISDPLATHATPLYVLGPTVAVEGVSADVQRTWWPEAVRETGLLSDRAPMCEECNAVLFGREIKKECLAPNFRGLRLGLHCCGNGEVQLDRLPELPDWLQDLWTGPRGMRADGDAGLERKTLEMFAVPLNNAISVATQYFDHTRHDTGGFNPGVTLNGRVTTSVSSLGMHWSHSSTLRGAQLFMWEGQQADSVQAKDAALDSRYSRILLSQRASELSGPEKARIKALLEKLIDCVEVHHPFVSRYKTAGELLKEMDLSTMAQCRLQIDGRSPAHAEQRSTSAVNAARQYDRPRSDAGVAILSPDDADGEVAYALVHRIGGESATLKIQHPQWDSLPHGLLFPHGNEGWNGRMMKKARTTGQLRKLTLLDYYQYRLQWRLGPYARDNYLFYGAKLYQEYVCKAFWRVEAERLEDHKNNPNLATPLRCERHNELVAAANTGAKRVGMKYRLPSSHVGGPSDYKQRYLDAMTVVFGTVMPSYMITVTCNPNWPEIKDSLPPGVSAHDRPDIIARVFKQRLEMMLDDIEKECIFGRVASMVHVVEFQKKGLPHAHILVGLADAKDRPFTADVIDNVMSAEIPPLPPADDVSPKADAQRRLREAVLSHHVHNDCSAGRSSGCPCINKSTGRCRWRLDNVDFQPKTVVNELDNGKKQVLLRRRRGDTGKTPKGRVVDNRHISTYVPYLVLKYDCHANIMPCVDVHAIKYLYKYVYKGPDRAAARTTTNDSGDIDQISQWMDLRWFCSYEAAWRLYGFPLSHTTHTVERLQVHLDGEQFRVWLGDGHMAAAQRSPPTSTLLGWLRYVSEHSTDAIVLRLQYHEFPKYFIWNGKESKWEPRKQVSAYGHFGRVYSVSAKGDAFYLRMYLFTITGADVAPLVSRRSSIFVSDLLEGHETFQELCRAKGLLADDREYHMAMEEALRTESDPVVRDLFFLILMFCMPDNPALLFELYAIRMVESLRYRASQHGVFWTDELARECALHLVRERMELEYGASAQKILEMLPYLDDDGHARAAAALRAVGETPGAIVYDPIIEQERYDELYELICTNARQKEFVDEITRVVDEGESRFICLNAPAGSGKTTCFEAILAHGRARAHDIIVCASTGIAALLLTHATTLHMRFAVPLAVAPDMKLSVSAQSQLAKRLRKARALLWDEAFMMHRYILEALDRMLRDVRARLPDDEEDYDEDDFDPAEEPFGGLTIILATDACQTLPVQPGASTAQIIDATHKRSELWKCVERFALNINVRIERCRVRADPMRDHEFRAFADFLLDVGRMPTHVRAPALASDVDGDPPRVSLDPIGRRCRSLVTRLELHSMLDSVYGGFMERCTSADYGWIAARAILCPRHVACNAVNDLMLARLPGDEVELTAINQFCDDGGGLDNIGEEILNGSEAPGIAPHKLRLKPYAVLMLMRNLAPSRGLSNGTRLLLLEIVENRLRCVILTGKATHIGSIVLIPRIWFVNDPPNAAGIPAKWRRRQFPVRLAWSMSINKSQGQTLVCIAVCLAYFATDEADSSEPMRCFAHGQLYVALSRVGDPEQLTMYLCQEDYDSLTTYNVVLHEVLLEEVQPVGGDAHGAYGWTYNAEDVDTDVPFFRTPLVFDDFVDDFEGVVDLDEYSCLETWPNKTVREQEGVEDSRLDARDGLTFEDFAADLPTVSDLTFGDFEMDDTEDY
jgi:hypothetical protein